MATLWIKAVAHAKNVLNYALREKEVDDPVYAKFCDARDPSIDFKLMAQRCGPGDKITAYHVRQCWSKNDSAKLTPAEFNQLGRAMIEEKFPGHMYLCVTHTETGNYHNHIVVCPWHSESGHKIVDKKKHLYDLRSISDRICRDKDLSVLPDKMRDRRDLPEVVRKIERDRGASWILDLCQKADFARAYATSYDQYRAALGELGVKVRIEDKNITYFYHECTRGKRGNKLGLLYDKPGLERAFEANDDKFRRCPELQDQILGVLGVYNWGRASGKDTEQKLAAIPDSTYAKGQRDYSYFTKVSRDKAQASFPHQKDVAASIIPVQYLRQARLAHIPDYCKLNNIALDRAEDGRLRLKGRPYVEISDYDWKNTKNGTRGSLIELVAAHKNVSLLHAVAEITGHRKLLVLEEHFGRVKRSYQSFHIPREQRANPEETRQTVERVLGARGLATGLASQLVKAGMVQVGRCAKSAPSHSDVSGPGFNIMRLLAPGDESGAYEYAEDTGQRWEPRKLGSFSKLFLVPPRIVPRPIFTWGRRRSLGLMAQLPLIRKSMADRPSVLWSLISC